MLALPAPSAASNSISASSCALSEPPLPTSEKPQSTPSTSTSTSPTTTLGMTPGGDPVGMAARGCAGGDRVARAVQVQRAPALGENRLVGFVGVKEKLGEKVEELVKVRWSGAILIGVDKRGAGALREGGVSGARWLRAGGALHLLRRQALRWIRGIVAGQGECTKKLVYV
ncbi:hypothetical protein ZIOFF_036303 [Zingiber officinale]|uniref:Uncharacterized protein n=1 Tax=Zingiber officinale TaxID=94328 RepID=A0A8J5L1M8_ZINOF|nr:hypothetical protein ZIOFF_036303 [Zingiber officinale]